MKAIKYFILSFFSIGFAVVFLIFALQNNQPIQLNLFQMSTKPFSLSIYILMTFVLGMFFSSLLLLIPLLKIKASKMRLNRQIKTLEKEIAILRNQPLEKLNLQHSVEIARPIENTDESSPTHLLQS